MKLGWAYLGIGALLVISGTFMAIGGEGLFGIGDILLVISIAFIYVGSNKLADENEAEEDAA